MDKKEFEKIITYVFSEHDIPTEIVKIVWWDQFKDLEYEVAMEAARDLKGQETYGAPKIADMRRALRATRKLPKSLSVSALEALSGESEGSLLHQDATKFADRTTPPPNGQYGSPEELDKANRIYRATWERSFKQRYDKMQGKAIQLVECGMEPHQAVLQILAQVGVIELPQTREARELLDCIGIKKLTE